MKKSKDTIQTFLGPETTLEGKLVFEGTVRLDGHFSGRIESQGGTVIVGEKAVLDADISVHTVTVSGEVRGNIRATDRIQLCPTARVFGDLSASVVLMAAGVVFQGNCTMNPKDVSASKTVDLHPRQ